MTEAGQITKTIIRVFIAACISAILTSGASLIGGMDVEAWIAVANAGLTAALTMGLVYVDPSDTRYGVKR